MVGEWWAHILWVFVAAGMGFLVAAYFAGVRHTRREVFLIPYVALSCAIFVAYVVWSEIDFLDILVDNLLWGIVGAVIIGAFLVFNVKKQPASPRSRGAKLAMDITWFGLVYGTVDALLLGVLPVMATLNAFDQAEWGSDTGSEIIVGLVAIVASVFVTAAYHAGYPEFRNRSIRLPILALAISSVGYLLAANPMPILGSHAAMHIAAVIHGPDGTVQLPPHYHKPSRLDP